MFYRSARVLQRPLVRVNRQHTLAARSREILKFIRSNFRETLYADEEHDPTAGWDRKNLPGNFLVYRMDFLFQTDVQDFIQARRFPGVFFALQNTVFSFSLPIIAT